MATVEHPEQVGTHKLLIAFAPVTHMMRLMQTETSDRAQHGHFFVKNSGLIRRGRAIATSLFIQLVPLGADVTACATLVYFVPGENEAPCAKEEQRQQQKFRGHVREADTVCMLSFRCLVFRRRPRMLISGVLDNEYEAARPGGLADAI